jgi:hypothetical protein
MYGISCDTAKSEPELMRPNINTAGNAAIGENNWRRFCKGILNAFLIASCALWPTLARAQNPASQPPSTDSPPGILAIRGERITIEENDRILRARVPEISGQPRQALAAPSVEQAALGALPSLTPLGCSGTASQPIEIATLAGSLKCDIDLIFEYVYNNIEYEPLFGSNRGALGTLLDQRGNDIDKGQLFAALLMAAGYSPSQINYQFGYITLDGVAASSWLGVPNDAFAIGQLLTNGGIPLGSSSYDGSNGKLVSIDIAHVWVQVLINGTMYAFDPSYKQHVVSTGLPNLGAILQYTQAQFMNDAGGTGDSLSISNINRSVIRNDLVTYAGNLVSYINQTNPGWTINDVVGGKTIRYLTGSPLRQTILPYLTNPQPPNFPQTWSNATVPTAYRTCFTISMPGVPASQCGSVTGGTIQFYSDET